MRMELIHTLLKTSFSNQNQKILHCEVVLVVEVTTVAVAGTVVLVAVAVTLQTFSVRFASSMDILFLIATIDIIKNVNQTLI